MKSKIAILLSCIIAVFLTGCHKKNQAGSLDALTADEVSAVTVLALSEESMREVCDETSIHEIVSSLQSLKLDRSEYKTAQYNNELVQFTVKKSNGSKVVLGVLAPYVCLNNVWYQTSTDQCEQLNILANKMLLN